MAADKRTTRTLQSIYKGLLSLMAEKPFQTISVKELCERADVNKSTFYKHFDDILDCRKKWMLYNVDTIFFIGRDNFEELNYKGILQNPRLYIERILDFIEENMFYLKKLYNSPYYGTYMTEFKPLLIEAIALNNQLDPVKDKEEYLYLAFMSGGITDTIFSTINQYDREVLISALEIFIGAVGKAKK